MAVMDYFDITLTGHDFDIFTTKFGRADLQKSAQSVQEMGNSTQLKSGCRGRRILL